MAAPPRRKPHKWSDRHQKQAQSQGHESWEAWIEEIEKKKGKVICGAWGKQREAPCADTFLKENGRCRLHGGEVLRGVEHPNFKTGATSAYSMRGQLGDDFRRALDDPDLIACRNQIALLQARELELVRRIESGESAENWARARAAFKKLEDAHRQRDTHMFSAALTELKHSISSAESREDVWEEIRENMEQKRKLAETERRRLEALNLFITAERQTENMAVVLDAVRKHVKDRGTLMLIAQEIREYVGGPARQAGGDGRALAIESGR